MHTKSVERGTEEFIKLNISYLSGLEPARIVQTRSKEDAAGFLKTIIPFGIDVKHGVIKIAAGEH
ncbi:unnamed protein product [Clonostachys rosea f. rosea IK726]|uniref:Uncharacterized protein n=1 Tax=Clonostachys rosea f. rosea IK726 TaxID=1349383 RepID=A0ACA9T951_BIOOC|nr:unnamed protein product [Clonostachys rosea f. rosea IK726]